MLLYFRPKVADLAIEKTGTTSNVKPPPRILRMLGEIQLEPWQCLAEFIDNSIDAFFGTDNEWEELYSKELGGEHHIHIDFSPSKAIQRGYGNLVIEDKGPGMTLDQVASSATAGYTGNEPIDRLGLFGMGFNIASARLGDKTTILSTKKGGKFWEGVEIDFTKLTGEDYDVPNVKQKKADVNDHGTKVIIEKLKKEINSKMVTPGHLTKMRKKLGRLYASIIEEKNIKIFFHIQTKDHIIKPIKHCIWDEKRYVTRKREKIPAVIHLNKNLGKQFFNTSSWVWSSSEDEAIESAPEGRVIEKDRIVRGWVGIQRFFDKKKYGLDLIRNGRVIEEFSKDVFDIKNPEDDEPELEYPLTTTHWGGRIVGEIHCDFLRLSDFRKDRFERYNKQWNEVMEVLRDVQPLRPLIAKKWGYDGKNNSPIGRLHRGYNHGKPVVDNLITKNLNNLQTVKGKEWVQYFWNGEKDYQDDGKWFAEVEAFEESLRTTPNDDDDIGGGDIDDPFGDDVDEKEDKIELKLDPGLSMAYEIAESPVSPFDVEVYVNNSSTLKEAGSDLPMEIEMKKNKLIAKYHSRHPDFIDFTEEPIDHLLMELAFRFVHKIGDTENWPLTKCYSKLRRTYRKDSLMDLESLSIRAREILNDVRSGIIESGVNTSKEDLNDDELNRIRIYVQREYGMGDEKVNEIIKNGTYVNTLPFRYLEKLIWDKAPDIMDGVVFSVSYKDLGADELKEKAVTNIVSCIRDLIDLEERTRIASVESGRKERLLLSKAALSLEYLQLLMN